MLEETDLELGVKVKSEDDDFEPEPKSTLKQVGAIILILSLFALMFGCFTMLAHGETTAAHRDSIGVVMVQDNPYQYLEGIVIDGSVHEEGSRVYTTLRVSPTGTYGLFTQDVTFCGNQVSAFDNAAGLIVMTYSRLMHQRWCYDLRSVHEVKIEGQ